jgi:hypothetical protein
VKGIQSRYELAAVEIRVRREDESPDDVPEISEGEPSKARWWVAAGVFLFVLACYVATNPGRIDVLDGQMRFDVAYNWLTQGRPIVRDPWVGPIMGVPGRNGAMYSFYGAPASVLSMPLVWFGLHSNPNNAEASQFLFSLTSSVVGALIAPLLFLFYLELGVTIRRAFLWTMVSSFATLVWPASCTTFDNAQHAFFGIAAAYLGVVSSRRGSNIFALAGGLMAGILLLYQEYFLLIVPALAFSTVDWRAIPNEFSPVESDSPKVSNAIASFLRSAGRIPLQVIRAACRSAGVARSSCIRCLSFFAGVATGVLMLFAYNFLRFGAFLENGKMRNFAHRHPVWGNPLSGLPTLLISPGKSLLLYSPPLLLGLLGIRYLWRRSPVAALVVLGASLPLLAFMSCYAGLGGDWCWGPRYLTILLPLFALAFPFIPAAKVKRSVVLAVVSAGFLVQILALSVETQRFFFEHALNDYFWAEDQWAYFKHSALFARVAETMSLADGPPATARYFNSAPSPDWHTYTILGPPPPWPRSLSPVWMRNFEIYYLPRPWPLWMAWIPLALRPVDLRAWLWGLGAIALLAVGLVYHGFRLEPELTDREERGPGEAAVSYC